MVVKVFNPVANDIDAPQQGRERLDKIEKFLLAHLAT
jgi:hypothetical protein